jgi:pilus assembly protein Flp/PilA
MVYQESIMIELMKNFIREEEGVTAIEYGLLAALIAVVIIVGALAVGTNLNCLFTDIANCLANPATACTVDGC